MRANALTVLKNGKMGLGTSSPNARLHINCATGENALRVQINGGTRLFVHSGGGVSVGSAITPPANGLYVSGQSGLGVTTPTYKLELPNNSTITYGSARAFAWITYSDSRVKTNRTDLPYGLNEIMKLKPQKYFQHNSITRDEKLVIQESGSMNIGLIAQDVFEIIPEVVSKPVNEEKDLWSMSYEKLVPVLIKGMQEQQTEIETLKSENQELKQKLNEIIETLSKE